MRPRPQQLMLSIFRKRIKSIARRLANLGAGVLLFVCSTSTGSAQTQAPPNDQTGAAAYQSYGGQHESISLATGNLSLQVPLLTLPGRNGHNLTIALEYDSSFYQLASNLQTGAINEPPPYFWSAENRVPFIDNYWHLNVPSLSMSVQVQSSLVSCWTNFLVILADGSKHAFNTANKAGCYLNRTFAPDPSANATLIISPYDSSFITLDTSNASDAVVRLKDGTSIHFPTLYPPGSPDSSLVLANKIEDTDGNIISISSANGGTTVTSITDTLNRTITFTYGNNGSTCTGLTYADSNGTNQTIGFSYSSFPISTDLSLPSNAGGVGSGSIGALSTITLPNNLTYKFQYNSTDGEISKITYPTGGYTRYDYQTVTHWWEAPRPLVSVCDGCTWPNSVAASFREITARHVCRDPLGGCTTAQEDTTTYTATIDATKETNQYMDVVDPLGNKTRYQFSFRTSSDGRGPWTTLLFPRETLRSIYSGQSTLLRTVQTDYSPLDSTGRPALGALPIRATTTLSDSNQVSKVEWDYDTITSNNIQIDNVIEKREFAYGSGAPGSLVRRTDYTWLKVNPINSVDYTAPAVNILNRKASETVYDSTSNQCLGQTRACAQTTYEYDSYTGGITASGATHHDAAFSSTFTTRGNVTAIHVWRNTDGATLEHRNLQFDDAGNVLQSRDPLLNVTKFGYTDSWANATCAPTGGVAAAYKTTVTNALNQVATSKYNSCAGGLASITDVNTQTINSTYDLMGRLTQSTLPDGGQINRTFNEAATPLVSTTSAKITSGLSLIPPVTVDGLGRVTQSQMTSDPQGTTFVDTTYDSLGRKQTVSNPYRTQTDPTYGITTYNYDALGRVIQVIPPDGTSTSNNVSTSYSDNCATSTDQAGKIRKSCTDALGRLIQVFEPDASNNLLNETDYVYDALNNLLSVQQKGNTTDPNQWRTRTFVYNSLSQLLTSTNPETGTITYTYDSNGNVLTKTDARNIITTLVYDALNRLTKKTFSDTTPQVTYWYDNQTPVGCSPTLTATNGTGRQTAMCDAAGWEAWSYDQMGHILVERRSTNGVVKTTNYTYNLDGSLASITYPSGKVIAYAPSGAGRSLSALDSASGVNFAQSALYAPHGGLTSVALGQATGFAGITYTESYTPRLQPLTSSAANPSTTIFSLTYNFALGAADNGNINIITNNLNSNRTQTFTYDQLNRVQKALTTGTTGSTCWGLDYSYDIWANLTTVALDPARPSCSWTTLNAGITTSNRVNNTGFSYDTAGNVISDGSFTYTWDGESKMKSAAGVNYTYDGGGRRVQKSSGKLYWYGATGEILAESDASGNITSEYIFFGGKRIARRDSSGNVFYYLSDHLDSSRVIAQSNGTVCYDADFDPFGGEHIFTNTCPQGYKFNGKERDAETGNDDFGARSYASTFGRFLSPDWSAIPAPVPYADLGNPQSLNQYAFVRDNPVAFSDPSGHQPEGQISPYNSMYVVARMRGGGDGCALELNCSNSVLVGYELTSRNGDVSYFATESQAITYVTDVMQAQQKTTLAVRFVDGHTDFSGVPIAESGLGFTVQLRSSANFSPGDVTVTAQIYFDADRKIKKNSVVLLNSAAEQVNSKMDSTSTPKTVSSLLVDVRPYNQSGDFGGKSSESGRIRFFVTDSQNHTQTATLNVIIVSKQQPTSAPSDAWRTTLTVNIPKP
jgi:RHS repeat-associated protein